MFTYKKYSNRSFIFELRIANVRLDVRTVILVIFSNIENKIQPESGNLGHPQNEM